MESLISRMNRFIFWLLTAKVDGYSIGLGP